MSRFETSEDELNVFLNVATLQTALFGNTNWLNVILESSTMRLKSGELNKRGRECMEYVRDHCPVVLWNKKEKRVEKKKTKAGNKLNGMLSIPFEKYTDPDTGKEHKVLVSAEEFPVFKYTLAEWRDIVATLESEVPDQ